MAFSSNDPQVTQAFEGLDTQTQTQFGGISGFQTAVQGQLDTGINLDVAIGGVLTSGPAPASVTAPAIPVDPTPAPPIQTTDDTRDDINTQEQEITAAEQDVASTLEQQLLEALQQASAPVEQPGPSEFEQLLEAEQARRAAALTTQESQIEQQTQFAISQQQEAGKRASGALKAALARTGALTATPEISAGVQASQERKNLNAINALTFQSQQLLQQARDAQAAGDFQLAALRLQDAQQAKAEIQQLQQQSLQNILAVSGEVRAIQGTEREVEAQKLAIEQQERSDFFQQLELVPDLIGTFDADERAALEQKFGLQPEFFDLFEKAQVIEAVTPGQKEIQKLALDAIQGGATEEDLLQILGSESVNEAIIRASEFLTITAQKAQEFLSRDDALKLGVPFGTTVGEAKAMNLTPKKEEELLGNLTEQQIGILERLQVRVLKDPDIKEFIEIRNGFERVNTGANRNDSVGDLALVNGYARMLDPGGVVRPSEFKTVEEAQGFFQQLLNTKDKIFEGDRLTEKMRATFADGAKDLYNDRLDDHQKAIDFYTNFADTFEIPTELVLRDFGSDALTSNTEAQFRNLIGDARGSGIDDSTILDSLSLTDPSIGLFIDNLKSDGITDETELLDILRDNIANFNTDLGTSQKGSEVNPSSIDTQELKSEVRSLTNGEAFLQAFGDGKGIITGIDGSSAWKPGLDFVLAGGKGAAVPSPVSGTIIKVVSNFSNPNNVPLSRSTGKSQNSGFGNQVKIRLADGSEIWISHLDTVENLRVGSTISQGTLIGTQGNTGLTLGNTGVHLDITMTKPNKDFFAAREVAGLLGDSRVSFA